MAEEFQKMSKDEALLNRVEQDIISGNKVPDHVMKYLEEKYPNFLPCSLEDKPAKKKKIKVNTKKVVATVMAAGAIAMSMYGLYNSSFARRDRAINEAHDYFNTVIAPQLLAENNINPEELTNRFYEFRDVTASELGIDNNCATYALLDYYQYYGMDDELYQTLGVSGSDELATNMGYKTGDELDQFVAPASRRFSNMEEGEFLDAITNYEEVAKTIGSSQINEVIAYEGESNAR